MTATGGYDRSESGKEISPEEDKKNGDAMPALPNVAVTPRYDANTSFPNDSGTWKFGTEVFVAHHAE
jgi:hypothetical protein